MDFWHEYVKLETLIKHGYVDQAASVGRLLLRNLETSDIEQDKVQFLYDFLKLHDITLQPVSLPVTRNVDIPVDDYIRERSPGVSVVTACMNRNENLLKAINSWIKLPDIKEVIVIDWSSDKSVYCDIHKAGLNDGRIKVVRVDDQPRWILTRSFNLGFRLASYNTILKADADIVLSENFFQKNKLQHNEFITGDWRIADENQEHINGFFYIHYDDLMKAHGFNEFIDSYGWDDDDLYFRLDRLMVKRKQVDPKTIFHLHHANAQRFSVTEPNDKNALNELESDVQYQIRTNRFIANSMPVWGRRSGFLNASIKELSSNYLVVEQTRESFHQVAEHIRQDGHYYSAAELVSWRTSRRVYDLSKDKFWQYLSFKPLDAMHRLDVSVMMYTDREINFSNRFWMLNCYADAYDAYFTNMAFLSSVQAFCEAQNLNIVVRVHDDLFEAFHGIVKKYPNLYAIPVKEAYGALNFSSIDKVGDIAISCDGKEKYFASYIMLSTVADLLQLVGFVENK